MRRIATPAALLAACLSILLASPARAQERVTLQPEAQAEPDSRRVAILRVSIDGASNEAASAFEDSLVTGLGNAGFAAVPRRDLLTELEEARFWAGCTFGPCLKRLHRATGIDLVLLADIRQVGQSYEFLVTLVDATTGTPSSQTVDRCAVCTFDDAAATATLAVIGLVTGAGRVAVTDPTAGPTATGGLLDPKIIRQREQEIERAVNDRRRRLQRAAYFTAGAAAVLAAVGGALLLTDTDTGGYVSLGGAGGLAGASVAMFAISADF